MGMSSVNDFEEKSYQLDSQIKLNLKATPIYYQNFKNYKSFSGYQLHFISMRQTNANLSASDDFGRGRVNQRDKSIF